MSAPACDRSWCVALTDFSVGGACIVHLHHPLFDREPVTPDTPTEVCDECCGTAVCWHCQGEGTVEYECSCGCLETIDANCKVCDGSGKCQDCDGDAWIVSPSTLDVLRVALAGAKAKAKSERRHRGHHIDKLERRIEQMEKDLTTTDRERWQWFVGMPYPYHAGRPMPAKAANG